MAASDGSHEAQCATPAQDCVQAQIGVRGFWPPSKVSRVSLSYQIPPTSHSTSFRLTRGLKCHAAAYYYWCS